MDLTRYDIRILGTDISNKVVAQASYGEYNRLELERGLPPETLARHFMVSGTDGRCATRSAPWPPFAP